MICTTSVFIPNSIGQLIKAGGYIIVNRLIEIRYKKQYYEVCIMKRTIALILTVLMIASLFTLGVNAAAKPTVEIKRGTPVIDGVIDEIWEYADEMLMDRYALTGDSKATGYAKMLWDEGNIYCLAVINDNTKSDQTTELYTEDCLEAFFDLDNKKTETYTEKNQFRFLYDIVSPLGIRNPDNISEAYADYLKLAGAEPNATQYVYEFSINEKLGIDLKFEAGKVIGIDFGYDDNTNNDTTRTAILTWNAEGVEPSGNPSVMGTVKLVDIEAYVEEIIEEAPAEAEAAPAEAEVAAADPVAPATYDISGVIFAMLLVSMSCIVLINKNRHAIY